jgi:simple sugar transport system ATP-binding protein
MMFGREVPFGGRAAAVPGATVLSVRGARVEASRLRIDEVSFEARSGEVIGLAGMEGSGQAILLSACAGLTRTVAGRVLLSGRDMTGHSYHSFMRRGVAYLPAARLEKGLVPGLSLSDHFVLSEGSRGLFIDRRRAADLAAERILAFNIKGAPSHAVESLSGGNQQRMLLALLRSRLSLVLLEHPTRGLDIESTLYIWAQLKERCARGAAIVFISSDLDEVLQYSDRVLVFFSGRVSPALPAETTTVERLGELIGGKGWDRVSPEAARA